MALVIALNSGYTWNESGETFTLAKLNRMLSEGSAVILSGQLETDNLGDNIVTAAKLAATLDLSSNTITWPVKSDTEANITDGSTVTPDSSGQLAIASDSGAVYVAKGTAATDWLLAGRVDEDSISETPNYLGQIALVSSKIYIATGTSSSSDWTDLLPTGALVFPDRAGDPTGEANKLTLWTKDDGNGSLEVYFRRGTGSVQKLTSTAALNNYNNPNWDSGWTGVSNNTEYDLSDNTGDNFSATSKSTAGATDASGVLSLTVDANGPGYRQIMVMFKPPEATADTDDFVVVHGTHYGNTNDDGWWIVGDAGNSKLRLVTAQTYVFDFWAKSGSTLQTSWSASSNDDNFYASGLMRIKIWT